MIDEMKEHIKNFISTPRKELDNFPICPFAAKSKITYIVEKISIESILINLNKLEEVLIIIDPDISFQDLENINKEVHERLKKMGYMSFSGHPEHDFCINGLYTRRDPYPNIQIMSAETIRKAEESLKKTKYYDNWSEDNRRYDEV